MPTEPREARAFAIVEVAAVIALAVVAAGPLPEAIPVALPLVVVASIARWVRRRSWGEVVRGGVTHVAIGTVAGAASLAIAVLAATPVAEALIERAVAWTNVPTVRGSTQMFAMVTLHAVVTAIAAELALRGWIVERVLELVRAPVIVAVLVGAVAEAMLLPGDVVARIGAGMFGAGLGWMYVAGGRSVVAPICARIAFQVGAIVLEALHVV